MPTRNYCAGKNNDGSNVSFNVTADGQVYKQTVKFVYLDEAVSSSQNLTSEVTGRRQRALACFGRYNIRVYDGPCVRLLLKVRLFKAGVFCDDAVRVRHPEPETSLLRQTTQGLLLYAALMPQREESKAQNHTLSYGRAVVKLREHWDDGAHTEGIVCWPCRTHGKRETAEEGGV